ncbi:phospholipid-binding lipoprotein MlaA [Pseudoduganella flava]|uniref:Phospholipid-binding lipoprotein MlaA n=1 Tax=Pseudoduganella flava TaxID=871742 RepID=A0A562Q5E9_9BURK|nr:VacJ family lipoprotein [Pseudoduganella flava]QGZ41313.1 VacJ family lipoprotein [Pseudoduganella flava]TWI51256.1 phospholipid-binding lipoprotein MlaA [Pseudoduganella flava]
MKPRHFVLFAATVLATGAHAADNLAPSNLPAETPPAFSGQPADAPIADPWERYNRGMYSFNGKVDKYIARPIGVTYDTVVPNVVQHRVTSFFANLREPRTMVNQLLQGRPGGATRTFGRFVVNTTAGIGGMFDPASKLALTRSNEDFGQTLAVWGWRDSRYFVAPLQGPSTLRDFSAGFGDKPLNPPGHIDDSGVSAAAAVVQLGSMRAGALGLDNMRELAVDEYAMVRDMWAQRRKAQIAQQ